MDEAPTPAEAPSGSLIFRRPDFVYAALLFAVAAGSVLYALEGATPFEGSRDWTIAAFFLAYGLFTITMGFPHPSFGHVSFDRVAQASSVLILGPVHAAWINGLASLIYPWHRLWRGVPPAEVLTAALNNSGIMTLMIFVSGSVYAAIGGPVPLTRLDASSIGPLLALMVTMQVLNDLGMIAYVYFRGGRPRELFSLFTMAVELGSVWIAVLVALVFNRLEIEAFLLLLAVLSLGMFVLRQFAEIRHRLEQIVEERTRALTEKTLELERQATQDKLTRLYNRRYADDYLDRQIADVGRSPRKLTVALADIDHFKEINDRFSHAQGDAVLKRVADLLREHCRGTDMVARYGGEEFLLCFPGTDRRGAERVCEVLRAAIEEADWSFVARGVGVTISFGIAEIRDGETFDSLLNQADDKLYEAKHAGRNQVVA